MDIKIEVVRDRSDWGIFVLLSGIRKQGELLEYELYSLIRDALIRNDFYTTINLLIIRTFSSKYSVIIYEMVMRYHKVSIPKLTVEEFKKLTGTEEYRDFRDIRKKVIEPAVNEISIKSDLEISYETFNHGRKVIAIQFNIKHKEPLMLLDSSQVSQDIKPQEEDKLSSILPKDAEIKIIGKAPQELIDLLPEKYRNNQRVLQIIDKAFNDHGDDYVMRNIIYTNRNAQRNYRAYLRKAMESDYGAEIIGSLKEAQNKQRQITKKEEEQKLILNLKQEFNARDLVTPAWEKLSSDEFKQWEERFFQERVKGNYIMGNMTKGSIGYAMILKSFFAEQTLPIEERDFIAYAKSKGIHLREKRKDSGEYEFIELTR